MGSDLKYVKRKHTDNPTGYIHSHNNGTVTVCWGVQDGRQYLEDIPANELVYIDYEIMSPEEVQIRQAREAGGHILEEGDNDA